MSKPVRWLAIAVGCAIFTACGGGGSDSTGPGGTPTASISYSIQIANSPAETSVRAGQIAEASVSWRFTKTGVSESTRYRVTSTTTGVAITGATGSSLPGVVITHDLSYECESIETVEAQLILTVGNATSRVTWPINCTGQRITVEPVDTSFGSVGVGTHTSLKWRYQSEGEDPQELEYTVSSTDESLSIDPTEGTSLPDTDIQLDLTFVCESTGEVELEVSIAVGTANETLLWGVVCTEESVVIDTSPESITVSIGETATGEISWHFQSTGEEPRDFSYVVSTSEEDLVITDGMGTSLPDTGITQALSYQCESEGRIEISFTISVGSANDTIDWSVECTRESVMVDLVPEFVSVSIGDMARSSFKWQVATTSEEQRSFDFLIRPENTALLVEVAEGQIAPEEEVTTNIEFRCVEAAQLTLLVSIEVGSERYLLGWTFECTEEWIEFAVDSLPRSIESVGEVASSELQWTLRSTAVSQREFVYSVSANESNARIGNATGVISPDTSITHEVTFACDIGRQIDVVFEVTIGLKQADISWQVVCVQDSIAIVSSPSHRRAPVGETVSSELSWEFASSYSDRRISFMVASRTSAVEIDPFEGFVSSGDIVNSNLSFKCTSRGSFAIDVRISAGGASRNLTWRIDCMGEDLSHFVATIYQGPRIATVEFEAEQDSWQYSLVPESGTPVALRFRTNRQVFLEIRTEHDEQPALPLSVQYLIGERTYTVSQIGETETQVGSLSGSRYSSKFLFDIAADVFTTHGEIQILIDPETRYPEVRESNNTVEFPLDTGNTAQLPLMNLTFVPIRTREGVPDLRDVNRYTRPIYELMPVGEINADISTELDASELSWSPSTGRQILDRLYEFFLTHGDRHTFFQGVVRQTVNEGIILCGNAFVGSNVSITGEITQECSDNTGAHEIGHGFNLYHAPACRAELANPDPNYPYPAGNIGSESGWLMKQRRFVDGLEKGRSVTRTYRYYDVMSYCPETFVSRYSYGLALDDVNRKFGVLAARHVEEPITREFGWVGDQSVVVTGSVSKEQTWKIRNIALAGTSAHRFYPDATGYVIHVVHAASGTVLHQESVRTLMVAHGDDGAVFWGVRIPYFDAEDLEFVIFDHLNRIVIRHDLTADLKQLAQ